MKNWDRLTDQQIKKAEAEGKLRGLEGEGTRRPDAARKAWQAASDPAEKQRLVAEIADLDMRLAVARAARCKFLGMKGD